MIYALFTLGGVAALIYEVMWMRSFSLVFGSSTRSAAAVLAAYFGGMALGNWLGARLSRRGNALARYGWCEIAIGATALLVGPWLVLYARLYPSFYDSLRDSPLLLGAAKLLLAGVSLGPPVVAMGATLPFIVRAMVTDERGIAGRTGLLYALNTLGATGGALLGGLVLPWSLGMRGSVLLAVGINVIVGCAAIALSRRVMGLAVGPALVPPASRRSHHRRDGGATIVDRRDAGPTSPTTRPPWPVILVAAISGAGTLSLEVMHVRLIAHRGDSSIYTFGLVLAVYLVLLAAGCLLVSRLLDRRNPWRVLAWSQSLAVIAILVSPVILQRLPTGLFYAGEGAFGSHLLRLTAAISLALGPPVLFMGMVLPAAWKLAATRLDEVSYRVGTLTSVNTIAAVAGSLMAGFVVLPVLGVNGGIVAIAVLYAALAALSFAQGYRGRVMRAGGVACALFAAAWVTGGAWRLELQSLKEGESLVRYDEGEGGNVAVIQWPDGHRRLVVNERYTLGASNSLDKELRQGRLPLLLHPAPKSVAYIGVATGISASALLDFPSVERCVAIEVLPGVVEAAGDFERWNRKFANDPRVEVVVDDGRNYLQGTTQSFDVIVGDLFAPWNAGVAYLYTVEQFKNVRARLHEGGVFVQWLPGHQLAVDDFRTIAASFLAAFPDATVWRRDFDTEAPVVALVGYRGGMTFDEAAVRGHAARLSAGAGPREPVLSTMPGVRMLYVCGPQELRRWTDGAPLNTDDRPIIEYSTSRNLQTRGVKGFALATVEFLASVRPRAWCYSPGTAPPPADEPSVDDVLRAADALLDAKLADARKQTDAEARHLMEAIPVLGGVKYVSEYAVVAAARFNKAGSPERSEAVLQALIARRPPPGPAFFALAMMRKETGEPDAAIDLLTRGAEVEPQLWGIQIALVDMLRAQQRYAQAEPYQRRLTAALPAEGRIRADLAHTLHQLGRADEARSEIETLARNTAPQSREALGGYLVSLGLGAYLQDRTLGHGRASSNSSAPPP